MTTKEKREAIACLERRKERLASRAWELDRIIRHTGNAEESWLVDLYDQWWEAADKTQQEILAELRAERGHLRLVTKPEDDEEAAA